MACGATRGPHLRAVLQLELVEESPGVPQVRVDLDRAVEPLPGLGDLPLAPEQPVGSAAWPAVRGCSGDRPQSGRRPRGGPALAPADQNPRPRGAGDGRAQRAPGGLAPSLPASCLALGLPPRGPRSGATWEPLQTTAPTTLEAAQVLPKKSTQRDLQAVRRRLLPGRGGEGSPKRYPEAFVCEMSAFPSGTILGHPATLRTRAHGRLRHRTPGPCEGLGGQVRTTGALPSLVGQDEGPASARRGPLRSQRHQREGSTACHPRAAAWLGAGRKQDSFALLIA